MSGAAVVLFVIPAVLLMVSGAAVWLAVRGARAGVLGRVAVVARCVAAAGTLVFAVLSVSWVWSEQQYGIVIVPLAALLGALVWNGVVLGAGALAEWVARRSRRSRRARGAAEGPRRI